RTDTIPFTGGNITLRNYDVGFGVSSPNYARFDASASILGGPDDNFFEWQRCFVWLSTFIVHVRPTGRARIEARYVRQQYVRWDDHTNVGLRDIPRLKVEYQLSRPIFLRFVGQYD